MLQLKNFMVTAFCNIVFKVLDNTLKYFLHPLSRVTKGREVCYIPIIQDKHEIQLKQFSSLLLSRLMVGFEIFPLYETRPQKGLI